jgi:hypothetical protein
MCAGWPRGDCCYCWLWAHWAFYWPRYQQRNSDSDSIASDRPTFARQSFAAVAAAVVVAVAAAVGPAAGPAGDAAGPAGGVWRADS